MSEATLLAPAAPEIHDRPSRRRGRQVRRRQPLPTGRAVIGGFLVSLSALAIFVAWSQATRGPTEEFVTAARDLPIGTRLAASDLATEVMELPRDLARRSAFDDPSALIGVKVISPIRKGELVQASALIEPASGPGQLEVSFAIDTARAVAGTLKAGEFIDLLATFGAGADTYTTTVLQGARVLELTGTGGTLGSSDQQVVTLAVDDAGQARAVAHAANVAKLTLVRSEESPNRPDEGGSYRAPAARSEADS